AKQLESQTYADAQHEPWHYQASNGDVEDESGPDETLAERQASRHREAHGQYQDNDSKRDRARKSAGNISRPRLAEQGGKPVRRHPVQREGESAIWALERQDVDADHRPIKKEHEQDEHSGERIKGPRPAASHASLHVLPNPKR